MKQPKTLAATDQPNLVAEIPQVSRRARAYKLTDDGASDRARRRRLAKAVKDSPERRRAAIESIRKRQAGGSDLRPLPSERAAHLISWHEKAIRQMESGLDAIPAPVIAPVARRVAREDRRRTKKASS